MATFSRNVHMSGPVAEVGAHMLALRDHVSSRLGSEVALWNVLFGAPVGTFVFTTRLDGIAGFQAMGASLAGDAEFAALVAKGADWSTGAPVDQMRESLNGENTAGWPPVGSVATRTTAVMNGGKYGAAVTWGLEVAALVEKITGTPVNLSMGAYGQMGQLLWHGFAADAATADAANAKISADAEYMAKLDGADGLFVPGSANRLLAIRMG
jgi:hypothetical protein